MIDSVSSEGANAAELRRTRRARKPALAAALDRLPPHSPEAELGVPACILFRADEAVLRLNECEERGVQRDWFYDQRFGVVYAVMMDLHKAGRAVDVITVIDRLRERGDLDKVGGDQAIASLADAVPSGANLPAYLDLLREKWQLRKVAQAGSGMIAGAFEVEDGRVATASDLIARAEKEILLLSEDRGDVRERRIKEILRRVVTKLEHYHRGQAQIVGVTTGLDYVDKLLCGLGRENGNYIVVSARPGTGKTALATQIALHAALDYVWWDPVLDANLKPIVEIDTGGKERIKAVRKVGISVGIFSLEMAEEPLVQRMLFQRAGADLQRWRTGFGTGEDIPRLVTASVQVGKPDNIFIDDTSRRTIEGLRASARRMFRQHGIGLFVIDYIQLIRAAGRIGRQDRQQELSDISGEIQALGKELNVPIIVIAQMNRDYEKEPNRRPRLSDLKDCGAIEQDADLVGFLYQPKLKDKAEEIYEAAMHKEFKDDWSKYPKRVDLLIAKNRYGPSDKIAQLLFEGHCTRFLDYNEWLKQRGHKELAAGERAPQRIDDEDVPQ